MDNWPLDFLRRMRIWLGNEADDFFAALSRRDLGLRLNSLRGPLDKLIMAIPWEARPVPWCEEGLWLRTPLAAGVTAGSHPYHATGVYYIQDPSAMAAGVILDVRPGEWVLDLAAAPGGKATHLAARLAGRGVLVANEAVRSRANILVENLVRMGVRNALVVSEHPERLAQRWPGLFDAVLVDAPCSGEGMFAINPQAARDWSLAGVQGNARRQKAMMKTAAELVRLGGRLLYCTCTFAPEENEGVVAHFLTERPDFEIVDLPRLPGLERGRPEWVQASPVLQRTGRFWPHKAPGHGHFYALLRRQGNLGERPSLKWESLAVPKKLLKPYQQVLEEILTQPLPESGLLLTDKGELYLMALPEWLWRGLHLVRPGLKLASMPHKVVRPDHALAMALRPEQVHHNLTVTMDDPRLTAYLQGGAWPDNGPQGVVLVTVTDFPLGWAERNQGRLRSLYPLYLRK